MCFLTDDLDQGDTIMLAWLIQIKNGENKYLSLEDGRAQYTTDKKKAIKFYSSEDANNFATHYFGMKPPPGMIIGDSL